MLNTLVTELFDYKESKLTPKDQLSVKAKLAPYCVYVENNFLSLFGSPKITKSIIEGSLFKKHFKYVSSRYSSEEILHLISIFRNCRNTMCHYLVRARESKEDYTLNDDSLLADLSFFDSTVCTINRELTLQGMLSLIMLFLNNEQNHNFIDLISNITELRTGKHFFKSNKEKGLSVKENAVEVKNQLKKRFKGRCNFSFPNYHDYIFLATKTAPLFLKLEEFCHRHWGITPETKYSTYLEPLSCAEGISEKTKKQIKLARNLWAHGNFKGKDKDEYSHMHKDKDRGFLPFLIITLESLKSELINDKVALEFLQEEIDNLAECIFTYKYKRLVELTIKIALPEEFEPEKRIKNACQYNFNYSLLSSADELRLWRLSSKKAIHFSFKNTIKSIPTRDIKYIDIYNFRIPPHMYAKINNVKVFGDEFGHFIVPKLRALPMPTIEIFDNLGNQRSFIEHFVKDTGFIKIHECVIRGGFYAKKN